MSVFGAALAAMVFSANMDCSTEGMQMNKTRKSRQMREAAYPDFGHLVP